MSNKHKLIWGLSIMSIVAIVLWQLCLKDTGICFNLTKEEPQPPSNHYEVFLDRLKEMGWQPSDANKPGSCSTSSTTTDEKSSPPSAAECELRNLQSESEIAVAVNDLRNVKSKGKLTVSQTVVNGWKRI